MKKNIAIVIVALLLVISFRTPSIIMNGRFWAEEGSVYFLEAYNNSSLNVLFSSNLGYYSLFNKIVMLFTVNVFDINYYPIVTVVFSILVMAAATILLLISEIKELSQIKYKILALYKQIIIKGFFTYWLIILLCVYYILIVVIVKAKSKNALFLFCSSLWITFLSYVGAIENTDNIKLVSNLYSSTAERYCLAPNVLLVLSIVVVLPIYIKRYSNSRSILNTIILLFCVVYLTSGIVVGVKDYFSAKYYSYFFEGPSWQKEISKWQKDQSYKILIWPEGWDIELNNRNAIKKVSK